MQVVKGSCRDLLQLVILKAQASFWFDHYHAFVNESSEGGSAAQCLQVEPVQAGRQASGDHSQEVAGHGEDLQVVGRLEHVVRKPCVGQPVVMKVHRPRRRNTDMFKCAGGNGHVCHTNAYLSFGLCPNVYG